MSVWDPTLTAPGVIFNTYSLRLPFVARQLLTAPVSAALTSQTGKQLHLTGSWLEKQLKEHSYQTSTALGGEAAPVGARAAPLLSCGVCTCRFARFP